MISVPILIAIVIVLLASTYINMNINMNKRNLCFNVKMDKGVSELIGNKTENFDLNNYNLRFVDHIKGLLPKVYLIKDGRICGNDANELKKLIIVPGRMATDARVVVSPKNNKGDVLLYCYFVDDNTLRLGTISEKCLNVKLDSSVSDMINFDINNFNIRFITPKENVLMAVPFNVSNMNLCGEGVKVATSILSLRPGQKNLVEKAVISSLDDNGGITVLFTIKGNDLVLSYTTQECIILLITSDLDSYLVNLKDFDSNSYGIRFISNGNFEKDFTPVVNNELCGVDLVSRLSPGMDNKALISSRVSIEDIELGTNAVIVTLSAINGKTILLNLENADKKCLNVNIDRNIEYQILGHKIDFNIRFINPKDQSLTNTFYVKNYKLCNDIAVKALSTEKTGKAVISDPLNFNPFYITCDYTIEENNMMLSQSCIKVDLYKTAISNMSDKKNFDINNYYIRFIKEDGDFDKDFTPIINGELCDVDIKNITSTNTKTGGLVSSISNFDDLQIGVNAMPVSVNADLNNGFKIISLDRPMF